MKASWIDCVAFGVLWLGYPAAGQDAAKTVAIVEKATLGRQGTQPFHLLAQLKPSKQSELQATGTIEFWWMSSERFRREIRTADFTQTLIIADGKIWEHDSATFFPPKLEQLADALVRPVPLPQDALLARLQAAEMKEMHLPTKDGSQYDQINYNWKSTDGASNGVLNGEGYLAVLNGKLFYTGGIGWGGEYHDFAGFHDRDIARTVDTAKIVNLEDLSSPAVGTFDTTQPGGSSTRLRTVSLTPIEMFCNSRWDRELHLADD